MKIKPCKPPRTRRGIDCGEAGHAEGRCAAAHVCGCQEAGQQCARRHDGGDAERLIKVLADAIPLGPHPEPWAEWIQVRLDFVQQAIGHIEWLEKGNEEWRLMGLSASKQAKAARAEDGTAVHLIEDLRGVLRWEEGHMSAVSADVLRQVIARLDADMAGLEMEFLELRERERQAKNYATTLAIAMHAKHYPEMTQWKPLPDTLGLLTQIDNMVSVLVRPCTCHPDDNPPKPCAKRYALSECRAHAAPDFPAEDVRIGMLAGDALAGGM